MVVTLELFGIARQRAGVDCLRIFIPDGRDTLMLGDLFRKAAEQCPSLKGDCLVGAELGAACIANIDGEAFVREPTTLVRGGQTVMLLSADAGG